MSRKTWYAISAAANKKTAEISIYDEIGGWGVGARGFIAELNRLQVDEIRLRIHSPGGSILEGNAIYNALRRHKAAIHVCIDGLAASMASVIAMAGDSIEIAENGILMIHNPWTGASGEADDLRKMADVLDKLKEGLITAYEQKTGLAREEISGLMDAETWMTAAEALEKGFVDFVGPKVEAKGCFDLSRFRAGAVDSPSSGNMALKELLARLAGKTQPKAESKPDDEPEVEGTPEAKPTDPTPPVAEEPAEDAPAPAADPAPEGTPAPEARASLGDLQASLATLRGELNAARAEIETLKAEKRTLTEAKATLEGEIRDATTLATQMVAALPIDVPLPRGDAGDDAVAPDATLTADEIRAKHEKMPRGDERTAYFNKHRAILMS